VEGEGPALVLQHGFSEGVIDWYESGYVEALRRDYRLILIDARGHGASDKPHDPDAYVLNRRVADVVAVLDALDIAKALYWGYSDTDVARQSMGGWIGFGMAKYAKEMGRHGYKLSAGTLYPILHGLEERGYLTSTEERSGSVARRVYRATELGTEALAAAKLKVRELFGELFEDDPDEGGQHGRVC
jgi:pimeloyl-ACP methyl ester carboxylesterase